ncbi:MAG: hypothetical protein CMA60_05760 [Euryarchaeota archaeon]|nr:hypothetical protein [Euryarchaeota archaeon]|tara:strand:- start:9267 stop:9740 length:474 start_codon:yes stop_codon:yes gene_type:complete
MAQQGDNMKIKTASDLKFEIERLHPDSKFFARENMRFFGDTMRNFGVREPRKIVDNMGGERMAYELYRKQPVKHGLSESHYFDAETLKQVHTPTKYHKTNWVVETGHGVQKYIRTDLWRALKDDFKGKELDEQIERGMNSQLCDLEEIIDISQWVFD